DLVDLAEVTAEVADADVLEHADARDLVVLHVVGQIEIVPQLDSHAILQSPGSDLRGNEVTLIGRKRNTGRFDAVVLRSPEDQAAPPAADVKQRLAGRQAELAADVVELVLLRVVERVALGAEIRARIDHPRVEPKPVERVR